MKKRIFCLALALLMLVGMLPVSSFADEFELQVPVCDQGCGTDVVSAHQDQCAVKEYYRGIYLAYTAQELYDMKDILGEDAWAFILGASWSLDNAKAQELNTLIQNGGPTTPENPCACCENCTGAEDCECGCGECDYCEPVTTDPTDPSDPTDPVEPEYPTLTDPDTNVAVTLETLPEGVDLEVDPDADVSAQFSDFGIPAAKQVFGLDITLTQGGAEYQPGGAYIKVPVNETIPVGTMIGIIHKHGNEVATFTGLTKVLSDHTVEFYTDSFSEFAGFTVDFHYNGVDFSIEGKTSILLSELFAIMEITEDAYSATSVVFSDNTLIGVEKQDNGDWLLTSLDSFTTNETLVITFSNNRTIIIDVTDAFREEFDFGTDDVSGHFNHEVVGFKEITVTLYKGNTNEKIGNSSTIDGVYGVGWLKLESSKYWFQIRSISGFLTYKDGHGYNDGNSQGEHHIAFGRSGSTNPTVSVNCWPLEITDSNPSQYCSLKRKSKIVNSDSDDVASRDVVIRVYRNGDYEPVQTISNLSFPDRNGDGDGHDVINFSRDLEVTSVATGYELAATHNDSNRTYYVDLKLKNYTITYDYAGGVGTPPSKSYTIEDTLSLPTPTKAGYDFKGWKVTTAKGNWTNGTVYDENTTSVPAGKYDNVTLTAQWKEKDYTVYFDYAGGYASNDPSKKSSSHTVTTGSGNNHDVYWLNPVKDGYTFTGWYTSDGTKVYEANGHCVEGDYWTASLGTWKGTTDLNLVAGWTEISYQISFNLNGATGNAIPNQTLTWGTTYELPTPAGKFVITYDHNYKVNASDAANKTTSGEVNAIFNGWEDRGAIIFEGKTYSYEGSEADRTRFDAPFYANPNKSPDVYNTDGFGGGHYNKYGLVKHFVNHGINEYYNNHSEVRKPAPTGNEGPGLYPGGAVVSNMATRAGDIVPLVANWTAANSITLPNITRTGYTLTGWRIGNTTYDVGATYTPTANVTAVAQWEEVAAYKVTYEYDGYVPTGAPAVPQQADKKVGDSVTVEGAPTPAPAGYTFSGWSADGITITNGKFTMPATDVTFTGSWTANTNTTYKIETYMENADDDNYTMTEANGTGTTGATASVTPSASAGFTFNAEKSTVSGTIAGDGSLVLKVYYDRIDYTLSLEKDAGISAVSGAGTYKYGASVTIGATVSDGYTWKNWTNGTSTVFASQSNSFKMPAGNVTYKANTTPISYTITYTMNGGTNHPDNPATYTAGSAEIVLKDPTPPTGYDFGGWSNGGKIPAGSTGNKSFTASWTPKTDAKYIVHYYVEGGTERVQPDTEAEDKTFNQSYSVTAPETIGNYILVGDKTKPVTAGYSDNEIIFYYKLNAFSVSYAYTGTVPAGAAAAPTTATKTVGSAVTVANAPTLTGYTFSGWTTDDVDVATDGTFTMPNKAVTFTGSWTLVNYTIMYELDGGKNNPLNPESYNVESEAITLGNPSKTGYNFTGWTGTDLADVTETVTIPKGSSGNRIYTANWTPKTYTITYNHNDKDTNPTTSTVSYDIEDEFTLNDAPTREGYKFSKWNLADGLTAPNGNWAAGDYDASQQIAKGKYGNITLVAQWTDQYRYVLKFNANTTDQVGNMPQNADTNWIDAATHTFTWSEVPTRENYDFLGWATSADATVPQFQNRYEVTQGKPHDTEEVTLYAVWQRQTGDLKLTFNGDQNKPAIVHVDGQGLNITLVLTKPETVIKDLPTGEYTVTAESGRATYTASVDNGNPTVVKGDTVTVGVTISGGNSNWFTAFFRVKNKCN